MEIREKDRRNNYKRFKKLKNTNLIINTLPINDEEKFFIKAFNIKNEKKRYEILYDYICDYLDKNVCILCDFKNGQCIVNRLGKSVHTVNGCCYFKNEGFCKLFKNKKCTVPNISCKLFMCSYIENKVMKMKSIPKNYFLLDFFFNKKQKNIIQRSYRQSRDKTIKKLLEYSKFIAEVK